MQSCLLCLVEQVVEILPGDRVLIEFCLDASNHYIDHFDPLDFGDTAEAPMMEAMMVLLFPTCAAANRLCEPDTSNDMLLP